MILIYLYSAVNMLRNFTEHKVQWKLEKQKQEERKQRQMNRIVEALIKEIPSSTGMINAKREIEMVEMEDKKEK